MKTLALALVAATMVVLSVPANAQRIYADGPRYYYDSGDRTYYGGWYVMAPRARTRVYGEPPYRYRYSRDAYAGYAYSGRYVGDRSWDGRYGMFGGEYRYRGWWRGW